VNDISAAAAARLADLRQDFDQVFAAPVADQAQEQESLIALQIEGDLYGLSVREITGVAVAGKMVPLPSRSRGLLGLTGIRGAVLPVYSLAVLLGYPKAGESVRWLALGEFEGYVRVPKTALHAHDREARKHVHRFAQAGEVVRAIISVASVVSSLQGSLAPGS
jgi:hypothetical protein